MTDNIFISKDSQLNERWVEAFPEAKLCVQIPEKGQNKRIIWLVNPGQWLIPELEKAQNFGDPVVVMSTMPTEVEAFAAVSSGAAGYCHHLATPTQLQEISTVVDNGGFWVGPELLQKLLTLGLNVVAKPKERKLALAQLDRLTTRERAVAVEVAHGATNKEVARSLSISERTVKAHLTAAFEKLGVNDRVQLALLLHNV
ncbi:MAG: response regulator transcription factor [Spongiibacteraceae bacterium]|nr:response regulator transcription factor [Spongiibacteraceae bacterium]